jgi:hypothetical protein
MAKEIEPKLKLISDYLTLGKNDKFVIPEYQRGYSWTKTQCDKLWQDIESFTNSDSIDPYFFGTVIVDCSKDNQFSLIDGQQRTTTFLLLLKALLIRLQEVLKVFKRDESSEDLEESLKEYRNKIIAILYKAEESDDRNKILKNWEIAKEIVFLENNSINEPYKSDLRTIIGAKDFDEAAASVTTLYKKKKDNKYTSFFKNFKLFYEYLGGYSESRLNTFAKIFLKKCQVIEIRSWQIEQAITMFNSLNSTGLPLSDSDIISAKLYSNAGEKKDEFNRLWEKINKLAGELNSRGVIDMDSILQQNMYMQRAMDKEYMSTGKPDVTTPGLRNYYTDLKKDLLDKPIELCERFMKIAKIWDAVKDYPIVKLLLKFNENAKLYLISYLYRVDMLKNVDEKGDEVFYSVRISEDYLTGICEALLRLFSLLELVDAGYSSSKFKTFLFGENVKLVDSSVSIDEIINDFNNHITESWKKGDDKEDGILQIIMEYDKNILVYLNEYLYAKSKNIPFDFTESVNVEHIMPASGHNLDAIRKDAGINSKEEFDGIVNSLGNKILLEENINKSIGKEWFETKKQTSVKQKSGYKDSKFGIAKALIDYPSQKWEKKDIEMATAKAAKRIVKFLFNET